MQQLRSVVDRLADAKVLVVGDVMLDRYLIGAIERVSPEGPGTVFHAQGAQEQLGGAAAVAWLLHGLGARTACVGAVGSDAHGQRVRRLLDDAGIASALVPKAGCTTVKERRVADGRLLYDRIDWEDDGAADEARVCAELKRALALEAWQALVVSDYGKGFCTPALLERVIGEARERGLPVLVDPARGADWRRYAGATVIKCNRVECQQATCLPICRLVVTLGAEGMDLDGKRFAARARAARDVTGCGDTVAAILAACLAVDAPLEEGCQLANLAAGLQVERLGVAQISRDDLYLELGGRVVPPNMAIDLAVRARREGRRVVFTNGCFDVLHRGHLSTLQHAKAMGDVLIVAVNSDASVRRLKGDTRPIMAADDRAAIVAAIACVDCVTVFGDDTPLALLRAIRPDVLVKGADYTPAAIVGSEFAGRVELAPLVVGTSTTRIVNRRSALIGAASAQAAERMAGS